MVLRITIKGLTRWQKHTHLKTNSSVKTSSCDLQSTFPTSREAEATNSPAQCEADLQSSARQCVWECVKEYETADYPLHTDPCLHSSQLPNMLIHTLIQTHTHTQWHKERLVAADDIIYVIKEMLKEVSLKFLENTDSLSSWELAADQFPLHTGMLTMKLKPGEVRMAYQ